MTKVSNERNILIMTAIKMKQITKDPFKNAIKMYILASISLNSFELYSKYEPDLYIYIYLKKKQEFFYLSIASKSF